ncbi:MAG: hypothetical protein H0T67_08940 [Burkholderiaceae bacterium]|nr:hypothetical protein [Burkholderiaceae bacterium]
MKKQLLSYLACVLVLSGCSIFHKDSTPPDPTRPQVAVVADRFIVVNQEPLVFLSGQRNVTITWQLPKDSKFRFARNGITVDRAEGEIDCAPRVEGALEFSCINRHTKPGKYSYTIRLEGARQLVSDPYIMNE